MPKTQFLELNQWVPSDAVNLDEINENFTILDGALQSGSSATTRVNQRAAASACNLANLLLHTMQSGKDVSFAQNAVLCCFRNVDDLESHLHTSSLGKLLVPETSFTESTATMISEFVKALAGQTTKIAGFWPLGYGTATSVTVGIRSEGTNTYQVQLRQNGQTLATSSSFSESYQGSITQMHTVTLSADLDPNYEAEIYIVAGPSCYAFVYSASVSGTAALYSSGEAVLQPQQVSGKAMRLFVRHRGTAPTVAYKLGSGQWQTVSASENRSAVGNDDAACTMSIFDADFGAEVEDIPLRIRFSLSSTAQSVLDCCAAVL